jgi:molybdopterin-containing oxidoreductase family iron-sulfur binding subunit
VGGEAVGVLVESHMGRPTKIEGNPDHPASLGATDALHQASVLTLYDPDRSQTVTFERQIRGWSDAEQALRQAMSSQRPKRGAGLRILTETVVSPTLAAQLQRLLSDYPEAKWHQYDPINDDSALYGAELAFGERVSAVYDFSKADVVLSLDADFLTTGLGHLPYARAFMSRRRMPTRETDISQATMNRLYVVESAVTCTGAKADHRLAIRGGRIEHAARAIAAEVGIGHRVSVALEEQKWLAAVVQDLRQHRGRCLVLAGRRQPPVVHLLAHALNEHLENVGQTVRYLLPIAANAVDRMQSLQELVADIGNGNVEVLIIIGGNPVYTAPADFQFAEILPRASLRFHLSLYADETSQLCQWHLPQAHYLESWGDARAFDGTASIVQPLIEPLYQGRTAHELIAALTATGVRTSDEIVREYWREHDEAGAAHTDFEEW